MCMQIFRGILFKPDSKTSSGFEIIQDAIVFVDNKGEIVCATYINDLLKQGQGRIEFNRAELKPTFDVILPGTVNTHCHTFQPPAVPGDLENWLKETLKFETKVKKNPELARKIAKAKFESYAANGITASLEYTTSSEAAARIVLDTSKDSGFADNIKVGYVCMNQNINSANGIELETSDEEAIKSTENLLKNFPGKVVVIDRFPIAVTSPLRKKLAQLARKYGALFETHANEAQSEAKFHAKLYKNARIIQTLADDGVFEQGSRVGLAHALHTTPQEFEFLKRKIDAGLKLFIRACPNSNAQLQSHRLSDGTYVPFPLKEWKAIGATVTFGLDKGAGRGLNIFAEAICERGRLHTKGTTPSYLELLKIATINGAASLGVDTDNIFAVGQKANFIAVKPAGADGFFDGAPNDDETLAGAIIEGGQDSSNIKATFVDGFNIK